MKTFVLDILNSAKGDDLERTEHAFRNYSPDMMDTIYGESGKTCMEILTEYRKDRAKITEAISWVESL